VAGFPEWDFVGAPDRGREGTWWWNNVRARWTRPASPPVDHRLGQQSQRETLAGPSPSPPQTDQLAGRWTPAGRPSGRGVRRAAATYAAVPKTADRRVFRPFNDYRPVNRPERRSDAAGRSRNGCGIPVYKRGDRRGRGVPQSYRRVDPVAAQQQQATPPDGGARRVPRPTNRYCGCGWCGLRLTRPRWRNWLTRGSTGVWSIFRIPKLGAAFYRAQVERSGW